MDQNPSAVFLHHDSPSRSEWASKQQALIKERNRKARVDWAIKSEKFNRLISRPHIAEKANAILDSHMLRLQISSTTEQAKDRLRTMPDLYSIVLDLENTDRQLIVEGLKKLIVERQRKNSARERVLIGCDQARAPLREHVRKLINRPQHQEESASELWQPFVGLLDSLELEPIDSVDKKGQKMVTYDFPSSKKKRDTCGNPIRTMTFRRFQNLVSQLRKSREAG